MWARDRWLGMDRPIDRRDFINGVAVAAGAAAGGMLTGAGAESDAGAAARPLSAAADRPARQPSGIVRDGARAARRRSSGPGAGRRRDL
jgi:hypothetical protein